MRQYRACVVDFLGYAFYIIVLAMCRSHPDLVSLLFLPTHSEFTCLLSFLGSVMIVECIMLCSVTLFVGVSFAL